MSCPVSPHFLTGQVAKNRTVHLATLIACSISNKKYYYHTHMHDELTTQKNAGARLKTYGFAFLINARISAFAGVFWCW